MNKLFCLDLFINIFVNVIWVNWQVLNLYFLLKWLSVVVQEEFPEDSWDASRNEDHSDTSKTKESWDASQIGKAGHNKDQGELRRIQDRG